MCEAPEGCTELDAARLAAMLSLVMLRGSLTLAVGASPELACVIT